MSLYIPSMAEIFEVAQSRGEDSDAPGLWRGLVGAWPFQEGGGLRAWDVSGERNHGTLVNGPTHVVGEKGRALGFGGVNDYVNCGTGARLDATIAVTIQVWLLPNSSHDGGIVSKTANGGSSYNYYYRTSGTRINFGGTISGSLRVYTSPIDTLSIGSWNHIVGTFDGASFRLYVGGAYVGQLDIAGTLQPTAYPLVIGAERVGFRHLDGLIALPAIYNRALTPDEIQTLYRDPWAQYRVKRRDYVFGGPRFRPWYRRPSSQIIGAV